jgi:hypothetical protein
MFLRNMSPSSGAEVKRQGNTGVYTGPEEQGLRAGRHGPANTHGAKPQYLYNNIIIAATASNLIYFKAVL